MEGSKAAEQKASLDVQLKAKNREIADLKDQLTIKRGSTNDIMAAKEGVDSELEYVRQELESLRQTHHEVASRHTELNSEIDLKDSRIQDLENELKGIEKMQAAIQKNAKDAMHAKGLEHEYDHKNRQTLP